jgi:hypothetical protein
MDTLANAIHFVKQYQFFNNFNSFPRKDFSLLNQGKTQNQMGDSAYPPL